MEKTSQPFETQGHDLTGNASLEFYDNESISSFVSLIPGMDINRFEPVALKIFISGETPLITLYAKIIDADEKAVLDNKVMVRKFKSPISWKELFKFVKSFDLVVHNGNYNLEEIEVDRK